jgi:2-oxoglutarate ferredoxin oxidoreductase subunit gamma
MLVKILSAGSGGQGVLTLGNVLGNAAMLAGYYVTFLPEYGAAVRGGTANCTVCLSDREIASPVASAPDILLAMNEPSVTKFISRVHEKGILIYNSSLMKERPVREDIEIEGIEATETALRLGEVRSANMVALGGLLRRLDFLTRDHMVQSLETFLGSTGRRLETSLRALDAGLEHV